MHKYIVLLALLSSACSSMTKVVTVPIEVTGKIAVTTIKTTGNIAVSAIETTGKAAPYVVEKVIDGHLPLN